MIIVHSFQLVCWFLIYWICLDLLTQGLTYKTNWSLNTQVGSHLRHLPFGLWCGAGSSLSGPGGEDSEEKCILWCDTLRALRLWKRRICRRARGQWYHGRHFRTVGELLTHLGLRESDCRAWQTPAWSHQVLWYLWESVLVWDRKKNRIGVHWLWPWFLISR